MFGLGPTEMLIVGVIAVLLFGSRLPNVARSMGKSLTEFKKGMQDLQDEVRQVSSTSTPRSTTTTSYAREERDVATAPKFVPPAAEPSQDESETSAPGGVG
jgi:sec-independent protein translocase protein TatA